MRKRMNNRGKFSIIAALFVAVILITTVMVTYSSIRYASNQSDPQILSAIDETNLALKQVLGYTVGYYGSVLQVTGNYSYGQAMSSNYLNSGLQNIANMRPEWGSSFSVLNLSLSTNWFTNQSFSEGDLTVNYSLTGLGVYGVTYSASCWLNVDISPSASQNQVCLSVYNEQNYPVNGLTLQNFKFYLYRYTNLTWQTVNPQFEPESFSNGTYIIDVPAGVNPNSYSIQVQDSRGVLVAASSFSHYTGTLTFNSTFVPGGAYVNMYNTPVDGHPDQGTHSNFTAQTTAPDSVYDTITEAASGTVAQPSYPISWTPYGSTSCLSGDISKLALVDGVYMTLGSYGSNPSPQVLYAHQETTPLGSSYYYLKLASSDQSGTSLSVSAKNTGRILAGKFDYPLTGVVTIPASSGTIYYRASADSGIVGRCDADILIREANGTVRATLSSPTASSGNFNNVWQTISGAYSFSAYTVVAQTDYLEVDYYFQITTKGSGNPHAYLRIDDSSLANVSQTRITNINLPTVFTVQAEFTGTMSPGSWNDLIWSIDGSSSVSSLGTTFQLYNWNSAKYPSSGDGYNPVTLGTSDSLFSQPINTATQNYLNSSGYWKINLTATKSTTTPFSVNLDLVKYNPDLPLYGLNLTERWTAVNFTYLTPHPALCIDAGSSGAAGLAVDAWYGGAWQTLSNSLANTWNNFSISSYLTSPNFTIRFRANNDIVQKNWMIGSVLLRPGSDQELFDSLSDPTAVATVELLQNGTMCWLGQNLTLTTTDLQVTNNTIPLPPVPVKALHVNETIEVSPDVYTNIEVPFQVEDWASNYTVPLGMTDNATVFGNRQMVVFLVNTRVSDFTVWWNGSDEAVQTPLAYTNTQFSDTATTLNNGQLKLSISGDQWFTLTSTVVGKTTSSQASFMRMNTNASQYGAGSAFVIVDGVVRDVIQQEAEWPGGAGLAPNGTITCPNIYANIVLTLPANAPYYTYQLRVMFLNSTQTRTINDLCPIKLTYTAGSLQTENGTALGDPVVASGSQIFFNSSDTWGHHWSQFTDGTKGAGIMFTNSSNQLLYVFDAMTPQTLRGALKADASAQTIQVLSVAANPVSFQYPLTVIWNGAVETFDSNTTPIYLGQGLPGLWVLAELPPSISVATGN